MKSEEVNQEEVCCGCSAPVPTYLGVKVVWAWPTNEHDAFMSGKTRGDGNRDGYTVNYEDGYMSWSPKDVFEKAYRRTDGMTFGLAIEALKQGKKVARRGWNGKGMWLEYVKEIEYQIDNHNLPLTVRALDGNVQNLLPWIGMKTADNKFVPWLASQTDMLAEDWKIVEQTSIII